MHQPAFIVATLTGSLLFGASVAGALQAPGAGIPGDIQQARIASATERAEAATQRAQAAMLVAAIRAEFPGHTVDVALDTPATVGDAPEQQEVQAMAHVRIDGSAPIPLRATALYDRETRELAEPTLRFEGAGDRTASGATHRALAAAAARRLRAEFPDQPVALTLADAEASAVGGRYLRLVARGTADFGAEGRAATAVEALYDPRSGEWLRLDYALGADPAQAGEGIAYAGP